MIRGVIRAAGLLSLLLPVLAGPAAAAEALARAPFAELRLLDKVSGHTVDLEIGRGQVKTQGRLTIAVTDCRYPSADPNSNAYAHLTIRDSLQPSGPVFDGWMVADSPALSAMDHARYDVWLLRCATS